MPHEVDRSLLNDLSRLVERNIDLDALLEATTGAISSAAPEPHLRAADGVSSNG